MGNLQEITGLKKGDLVTLFTINAMAMTSMTKAVIETESEEYITFKMRVLNAGGKYTLKRKVLQAKKSSINLAIKGHDIPVSSDMDCGVMRGNACLNLVSDMNAEEMQDYIIDEALFPIQKGYCFLAFTREQANDIDYDENKSNLVFPQAEGYSAVVERIKSK